MIPEKKFDALCKKLLSITDWINDQGCFSGDARFISPRHGIRVILRTVFNAFVPNHQCPIYYIDEMHMLDDKKTPWIIFAPTNPRESLITREEMNHISTILMPALQSLIEADFNRKLQESIEAQEKRVELLDNYLVTKV